MRESIKLDLATPDGDDLVLEIEYDDFDDTRPTPKKES